MTFKAFGIVRGTSRIIVFGVLAFIASVIFYKIFVADDYGLGYFDSIRNSPGINVVPTDLPETQISKLDPKIFEHSGVAFQLPCEITKSEPDNSKYRSFYCANGDYFTVTSAPAERGFYTGLKMHSGSVYLSDGSNLHSEYDLLARLLPYTTDQIHWWMTAQTKEEIWNFLFMKRVYFHNFEKIYRIQNATMKGFQFGVVDDKNNEVQIHLFTADDKHFEIDVNTCEGRKLISNQADLNAIVASMHIVEK